MVHQSEALGVVQLDRGGCGEDQQEDEEQAEVESLPQPSRLVKSLILAIRQRRTELVVVIVVGDQSSALVVFNSSRY